MHGSKRNLQLLRLAPQLETLILWPSSRSLGSLVDVVITLLPTLRCLSLDVVKEPAAIEAIATAILVRYVLLVVVSLCKRLTIAWNVNDKRKTGTRQIQFPSSLDRIIYRITSSTIDNDNFTPGSWIPFTQEFSFILVKESNTHVD
jgi:hypothetical protein